MKQVVEETKARSSVTLSDEYWQYFTFLDDLRESGKTNMFGATPFLVEEFELDEKKAREILGDWMKTFSARDGRIVKIQQLDRIPDILIDRIGTEVKP